MDVKEIRLKALLTQEEFAKQIDVSVSAIRTWEQGVSKPSLKSQKRIKEFCKINNITETQLKNLKKLYGVK